ncbi:MAG: hypothetical protein LUC32_08550, partial [Clostridiales bacterium]|nr:hypothetical protein [Clostridiales bacterium]
GELLYSLAAEPYLEMLCSDWGYNETELLELYQDEADDYYREGYEITYDIMDVYKADKDEIRELNAWLEDYGFEENSLKKAVVVTCDVVQANDEGYYSWDTEHLIIYVNGAWCITGGYINVSWYEN